MKTYMKVIIKIINSVLLYGVMALYLFILFLLLFNKRDIGSFQSINIIPFNTIVDYLFGDYMVRVFAPSNILGNIFIFLPLGIYISLINRNKSILINVSIVTAISVVVEILQYIFMVGATDIDDVILKTIGGLLGVLIYRGIELIFKNRTKFAIELLAPIGGLATFLVIFFLTN